jgi:hypothetical protein
VEKLNAGSGESGEKRNIKSALKEKIDNEE